VFGLCEEAQGGDMRHVRGFRDGILAALVHAKGSFGVCVGVQGGHTGYVRWFTGVIWGV